MPSDRMSSALGKHGYKQLKKIGEGSFGAAILVQHDRDKGDSKAIVKMIDISRATKQEKEDAVKESKVLSSLRHPYIVKYRESFHEDGWLCIVMDYCEGGDLSDRVKKMRQSGRSFSQEQVVRWFTQGILALKYIHDMHILHRDLKSGNFFLSKSGNLKMGDFGIAKVLECTAACAQTQIGTPYYLSPEICQGKPYAWSSDVWSMGCILFELCARKVPFDAPDLKGLIQKITRGATPEVPSEYSAGLRDLCRELLNRDASRRPQAAEILKRPVVQEMVRKMLEEVKDTDESEAPVRPSPSVGGRSSGGGEAGGGPGAPRPPAETAGTYVKGQNVDYYSETHKEWLCAQVTNVDPDGRIMMNVKPNVWISLEVQRQKVRERPADPAPPQQQHSPPGRGPPGGGGGGGGGGRPPAQPGSHVPSGHAPRPLGMQRQPSRDRVPSSGGARVPSPRRDLPSGGAMRRPSSQDRFPGGVPRISAPSPGRGAAGVPSSRGSSRG